MADRRDIEAFEKARPMLLGLAYRILGSRADAEDAVQDTFMRWQETDRGSILNPASWLTSVCARRCIDVLRSAERSRLAYVGPWLPEPIQTAEDDAAADNITLGSSLSTAFLLLLERLTPKERAAYLLHELFEVPYPDVAETLGVSEPAIRKLVSRARARIGEAKVRHVTPRAQQEKLAAAFQVAVQSGETGRLASLLSDEIELAADSGGKVPAILKILRGKADVLEFIAQSLRRHWGDYRWVGTELNGGPGLILLEAGSTVASVSFAYDAAGAATHIFIVRNPDKLGRLKATPTA